MCNEVAEQKLDPDLKKKPGKFPSNLAIFEKKKFAPNHCGMGIWCYTCPNLIRTVHQMVLF